MNDRDFKGVWVPKEIYLHPKLTWTEKILLIEIHSLDKGEGCWASNEYLAKFIGCSESTIANSLTNLRKVGALDDRSFDGRKRYLSVNPSFVGKAGFPKSGRQGSRNQEGRVPEIRNEENKNSIKEAQDEPQEVTQDTPSNTSNNTSSITRVAQKAPRGQFGKYNEAASSDSYESVIDSESGEVVSPAKPAKNPELHKQMLDMIHRLEKRRGSKFVNYPKQLLAIKKMKIAGIRPDQIERRWIEFESDPFWREQGFDLMSIASSFDKKQ